MRKFMQVLMGVFALALTSIPSIASAQELEPTGRSALIEEVPGVVLSQQEYIQLWNDGCVVGPTATVAPLLAKMERKGVPNCSPKFYSQLDDSNKEGSMIWWAVRAPDGIEVCTSLKGINVANNRISCRNYSSAGAANGSPRFSDSNYHVNGGTIMAQTLSSLANTIVAGPLTAATGQLLAPKCGSRCNNGPTAVIYNDVDALSQAISNSSSILEQVGSGGTGPCSTCGTKTPTNPNHTPNGPGN